MGQGHRSLPLGGPVLDPLLSLLATKAKTVALVAGTAVITAGAVGGSTVALQTVSSSSPASEGTAGEPEPSPVDPGEASSPEPAPAEPLPTEVSEPAPSDSPAPDPLLPPKPVEVQPVESEPVESGPVESEPVEAPPVAAPPATDPAPAFVCDPAKNHGQNVSAYARSLPKGPGRGALVSAAAQSDCGKTVAQEPEVAEPPAEEPAGREATVEAPAEDQEPAATTQSTPKKVTPAKERGPKANHGKGGGKKD